MWHRPSLFFLLLYLTSCQPKANEDPVGSVYYESWVFVGRDSKQAPLIAALSIRKLQQSKKKVEIESKLFGSKDAKTRLFFSEKKTKDGNAHEVFSADPISLQEVPCGQQKTCLHAEISREFFLELQSDPLPTLSPHAWHDARIGTAITTATLSVNQVKTPGCLFVERGVSLTKPPEPFFGDFDSFALLDDEGDCRLISEGSRVGGFALSREGATSTLVQRQGEKLFLDNNSGQQAPSAWSLRVPQLGWELSLAALDGHRGVGDKLPSGKSVFFGQGVVQGSFQSAEKETRQCIGWVQHVRDE